MKILVTGGAGFIGSHVVDRYLNEGFEVIVIDDLSTGVEENINKKAKFYKCDICSDEVRQILKKERPDIINHHAAQIDVRFSVNNPLEDIRINLSGLVSLLEEAVKLGVKKVILASSGGTVYGEQEVFPATESHSNKPISPYGLNKFISEKYLYYYWHQYGVPYVSLRYSNVYGPRQNPHGEAGVVAIFSTNMLMDKKVVIYGDGKQTRDYVYVDDVVNANFMAISDKAFGEYNVGTGIEADVNEVFRIIKQITGSNCDETHGEARPGEQLRSSLDCKKIMDQLGWEAKTNLETGLKKTVEWFS